MNYPNNLAYANEEKDTIMKLLHQLESERNKFQKQLFDSRIIWDKQNNTIYKLSEEASVAKLEQEIYMTQLHNLYFAVKTLGDK